MFVQEFTSTVGKVLERSARRHPTRTALTFEARTWTYAELDCAVSRVAARLLEIMSPGDRVAAFGMNSDAYVLLYLGCARTGLVHVPINYNARHDELAYLLTQSEPAAVFCDAGLAGQAEDVFTHRHHPLRGTIRGGTSLDVLEWARDEDASLHEDSASDGDLVQLLYTSGTTSRPKAAMLTHRALIHEYASCIEALDLRADDVLLHALPLYHSAQMHAFLLPGLAIGATNHLIESPEIDDVFAQVPGLRITSLFLPPTVWVGVVNDPRFGEADLSTVRKAYYGASIMPVPVLQKLQQRLPQVGFYNCFGQTEIGPLSCVLRPDEHADRPDSAGKPVLFVDARIVDEDMNDVTPGELGEVVYRSPQLCLGYWNKPQETAEAFRGGWFHSGDLACLDDEGYIFVVDRIKDVVNTGGVLVASREVEDALSEHPAVAEVAVIGLPDPRWIEAVTALVVVTEPVDTAALQDFARQRLAAHKVPKAIHVVESLPKNASGKLLKRQLRTAFGHTPALGAVPRERTAS